MSAKKVPLGEQYDKFERELKKKYRRQPEILADMDKLTTKLCNWYLSCFARLILESLKGKA